ncbi:MAG: hypothetical protein O3B01_14390 [Planctomycetota bacterium]|nr:hypothetical protein [Planctomycetota bacterium]MDA1139760.1 hypothetical protein [Planctomycetota bacterium]
MPPVLTEPFAIGLYLGLVIACIVWAKFLLKLRESGKELKKLKQHLQTQLDLEAESKETRKQDIEKLKKENENMRITLANLSQKPEKAEIRQFYVYQKAIDLMFERAPGFAPAWQNTLKEAEGSVQDAEHGIVPLMKRVFASPFKTKALPARKEEEEPTEENAETSEAT